MNTVDLFSLANNGVNASSKLLQTTSNNIANVNTQGYVRERTEVLDSALYGVKIGSTERVLNTFAQNQLRRDITAVAELRAFSDNTSFIDDLLASEANSISKGVSEVFAAIQTAADDPTNLASREQALSKSESLYQRMRTLSDYMVEKEEELNLEFTTLSNRANSLISNIGELNANIIVAYGNDSKNEPTALLNERDRAINELSEIVAINVSDINNQNGAVKINLLSGQSLVLENGDFNLVQLSSGADQTFKEISLSTQFNTNVKNDTQIPLIESDLGGTLGGLFRYRNEVLGPTMRDIGQLAIAFADAFNSQNKLGMDLDGQLGQNIFNIPTFEGLAYEGTVGNFLVSAQVTEGKGAELTDADYKIEVAAVSGGLPSAINISLLNPDGTPKKDASGSDIVYTSFAVTPPGFTELPGGIEIDFSGSTAYTVGNEFLIQPTKNVASEILFETNRPEDLAFASPIRAGADSTNLGSANITNTTVTNTIVGAGSDRSAFDGAGGIDTAAPAQIVFTSADTFNVLDGTGTTIATVTGAPNLDNLLEQAKGSGTWPGAFSGLSDYPGYDFSLDGVPRAGDSFSISYNTDGFNDNTNALKLAELQNKNLVQVSSEATNTPRTFQDAYASMVGRIGEESAMANVSLASAEAMKVQSENWFESVSGVSLDEEAANLIKYQQSYAAAARILTTAQELFNTILQSAR